MLKNSGKKSILLQISINLMFLVFWANPFFAQALNMNNLPGFGGQSQTGQSQGLPPINIPKQPIPGQQPFTLLELQSIIGIIGNFFVVVGPVLLVIALILSGITLATGGASQVAVAKAKKWFGYSLIGGLVIFGSGVIINTIAVIVTRQFFCRFGISLGTFGSICIIK